MQCSDPRTLFRHCSALSQRHTSESLSGIVLRSKDSVITMINVILLAFGLPLALAHVVAGTDSKSLGSRKMLVPQHLHTDIVAEAEEQTPHPLAAAAFKAAAAPTGQLVPEQQPHLTLASLHLKRKRVRQKVVLVTGLEQQLLIDSPTLQQKCRQHAGSSHEVLQLL